MAKELCRICRVREMAKDSSRFCKVCLNWIDRERYWGTESLVALTADRVRSYDKQAAKQAGKETP